ncbi:hypothetical protein VTN00DRAFT_6082 [Thermoascus crustaceus]|uniref:uncharacterized protein n=1 Tax=Thermoascus crustaceus TaxID=5088 RepID=UPI00374291E5
MRYSLDSGQQQHEQSGRRCSPVERLERRSPGSGMLLPRLSGINEFCGPPCGAYEMTTSSTLTDYIGCWVLHSSAVSALLC